METQNKDKKIGVFVYEFLGTAFIMFALIIENGDFAASGYAVTFCMMCIAYNVSGGHFNPAISIGMYVAEKNFGGNLITLGLMVAGQFAGAFFGILLGFLAVIDADYNDKLAVSGKSSDANVPADWVSFTAFLPEDATNQPDDGILMVISHPNP